MPERRAVVASKIGLHLRVAAEFARLAGRQLPVKVMVAKDGREPVEARRMLDVLKLDVLGGQEVLLSAEGEGAERALDEMVAFVETDHDAKPGAGAEPASALRGSGSAPGSRSGRSPRWAPASPSHR